MSGDIHVIPQPLITKYCLKLFVLNLIPKSRGTSEFKDQNVILLGLDFTIEWQRIYKTVKQYAGKFQ